MPRDVAPVEEQREVDYGSGCDGVRWVLRREDLSERDAMYAGAGVRNEDRRTNDRTKISSERSVLRVGSALMDESHLLGVPGEAYEVYAGDGTDGVYERDERDERGLDNATGSDERNRDWVEVVSLASEVQTGDAMEYVNVGVQVLPAET